MNVLVSPSRINRDGRVLYVIGQDWTALGASPEQAALLANRPWWTVVNAPRPLPYSAFMGGAFVDGLAWEAPGPRRYGWFFAAGDPAWQMQTGSGGKSRTLGHAWTALDAHEVRLVDRAGARRLIEAHAAQGGYSVRDYLDAGFSEAQALAELAAIYNLPWTAE